MKKTYSKCTILVENNKQKIINTQPKLKFASFYMIFVYTSVIVPI